MIKKISILILFIIVAQFSFGQINDSIPAITVDSIAQAKQDSINKVIQDSIDRAWWVEYQIQRQIRNDSLKADQIAKDYGRYKLYPTQNNWNFILLDTGNGRTWQVQYGVNGSGGRMKVALDTESKLYYDWDADVPGRFELYPTTNFYNFILLDKISGKTWQVQWHTSSNSRFSIRIY